jgi:CheY-like chemotaxis protein
MASVSHISLRALLAEDSPARVELIRLELSRHGFEIQARVAGTREEFRAAVTEGPWDLVLSDQSMKGLTPADALQVLREHDTDTPFVIVSGSSGEDAGVELNGGAQDHAVAHEMRQLGPAVARELREAANRRMQRSTEDALQAWNIACGTRNARKLP